MNKRHTRNLDILGPKVPALKNRMRERLQRAEILPSSLPTCLAPIAPPDSISARRLRVSALHDDLVQHDTQGLLIAPWRDSGALCVYLAAQENWQGCLRFDGPRHTNIYSGQRLLEGLDVTLDQSPNNVLRLVITPK
jgi:hypothetical protein